MAVKTVSEIGLHVQGKRAWRIAPSSMRWQQHNRQAFPLSVSNDTQRKECKKLPAKRQGVHWSGRADLHHHLFAGEGKRLKC